ncbi:hypothetical protein FACS189454_08870 [Planctomycetales bacterium]|nr:hypothetical protein FACS189454_08870 [Planctomycetales bacterium]
MKAKQAIALFSATLFAVTSSVSAEEFDGADPATPVAGITKQVTPQPQTRALLDKDANRNIRWEPWEYRSAFSASVLEQIQELINNGGITLGKVYANESDDLRKAIEKGAKDGIPELREAWEHKNKELDLDKVIPSESKKNFKLRVFLYRHNYTDTGLFQLYVSASYTFGYTTETPAVKGSQDTFKDIQGLQYEFDDPNSDPGEKGSEKSATQEITLWRGVVVRVDATGKVTNVAGDIPGVQVGAFNKDGVWTKVDVKADSFADWELAPVLRDRAAYAPNNVKDHVYVHPKDRLKPDNKLAAEDDASVLAPVGIKPAPARYNSNAPRSTYRPRVNGR